MAHAGSVAADHAPATRLSLRAKGRLGNRCHRVLVRPFRYEKTGIKFNQWSDICWVVTTILL
jgi:hypothetical protein